MKITKTNLSKIIMQSTLGQRIKIILLELDITYTEMSRASGVANPTLHRMLADQGNPTFDTISKILTTYPQVSADYLLQGMGTPLRGEEKATSELEILREQVALQRQVIGLLQEKIALLSTKSEYAPKPEPGRDEPLPLNN